MASSQKKPKISIKPFRQSQVQMDPDYPAKTWLLLKNAIHQIHKQNASELSFEELYRNAYNMVLHKYGEMLYNGVKDEVQNHLKEVAVEVSSADDGSFLSSLNKVWGDHKTSMLMIRDILMYMDRTHVTNHNIANVFDLGLALFRDNVARAAKIKDRLLKVLLYLVHRERLGEVINRLQFKNINQMLIDLGINTRAVYEEDFERHFLETSAHFYKIESNEFVTSNSCADYLKKAEARIKEEVERVHHYMDLNTEPKLKDVVEKELIANHLKALIEMENSGMVSMLRDTKIEDLKRMYSLFGRVSTGHSFMREILGAYVKSTGLSIITDEEKQKDHLALVSGLLELKDKYDVIVSTAFANDKTFIQALNSAFEHFINKSSKSPEFISLFIDEKLKKGLKGVNDADVDSILDKVMMLFRFIQEKDVFEKYYKQHLAKRLLLGRSVSDDAERNMIAKLKTECGYQFTCKLEGMFTDMKVSNDTMESFKSHVRNQSSNPLGGIDLTVFVLTTGYWPTQVTSSCLLPEEIQKCCDIFKAFYLSKHNGRKLTFQTNMGMAELKANFGGKKHEVSVSTYQMVLLLLFNAKESFTYKELKEATGMQPLDLNKNLMALAMGKIKLLNKNNDEKKITEADTFSFNAKFRSKLFKLKVTSVQTAKETEVETKETREKVDEDRKHQIEAAIVRIMKSRKSLEHNNLISEVTQQLQARFVPAPAIIKKRIESLIERDYLRRSANDRKMYEYVA